MKSIIGINNEEIVNLKKIIQNLKTEMKEIYKILIEKLNDLNEISEKNQIEYKKLKQAYGLLQHEYKELKNTSDKIINDQ